MKQANCANCGIHFVAYIMDALSKDTGRKKIVFHNKVTIDAERRLQFKRAVV